jgi:hypothetical protein
MTTRKERLTVTVDPELIEAGNQAVAAGDADSLSGWVNAALAAKATHDRRLRALADAVASYEAEFGEITAEEMATQQRADRQSAVIVRGRPAKEATKRSGTEKRRGADRGKGAA